MNATPEELEKIAQEEAFPARYYGMQFPGEWPSEDHHRNCLALAKEIHEKRGEGSNSDTPTTTKVRPTGRRVSSSRKEKNELDERSSADASGEEQ